MTDLANACSVPTSVAGDWIEQLGEQSQLLARALMERAPIDLRAQTISRDQLAEQLRLAKIETIPIANTTSGLRVIGRGNIQATSLFKQGKVEIQDASSQQFIDSLGPLDGVTVWDICAQGPEERLLQWQRKVPLSMRQTHAGTRCKSFVEEPNEPALSFTPARHSALWTWFLLMPRARDQGA